MRKRKGPAEEFDLARLWVRPGSWVKPAKFEEYLTEFTIC
jgi:hypothetical protein